VEYVDEARGRGDASEFFGAELPVADSTSLDEAAE
jgi:hypothetical protein